MPTPPSIHSPQAIQSCAGVRVLLERCATVFEARRDAKTAGQHGDVAQLAERLLCKQGVVGSSPIISTITATALLSRGADGPSFG